MNIKKLIAEHINKTAEFSDTDFEALISESISNDKGDYSLPCFVFSKALHKSPQAIAESLLTQITNDGLFDKVEVVGGYVNFFLNKEYVSKNILTRFDISELTLNDGDSRLVLIDYCSPNVAKALHIGHLKTTIIGESLARLFTQCGYRVKRVNFLGDYGTPFGKIIGGLLKWGSFEEVKARGIDALQDYYIRFCKEEADDEALQQYARDIFQKIEQKDAEIYPIYQYIVEIALDSAKEMFSTLGVSFDDYRGEMYYNQYVPEIIDELKQKGLLVQSQDAQIVDLNDYDLSTAVILKNDGTTLYLTRDISAVVSRYQEYKFDKILYVTDVAQVLHFKQLSKIIELMGYPFSKDIEHVPYGRYSLPDGKISSRKGKQAVLVDLIDYIKQNATEVIKGRSFTIERPDAVVEKVARAVLNYSVLKVERTKDCVFDTERAFSFDGETAPYMLYTYTRLASILRKYTDESVSADFSCFDNDAFELVKYINDFTATMRIALEKRDSSILAKRIMDMCKAFNKFYTTNKVLDGNANTTSAKIQLVRALRDTLKVGFNLICIDTLEEM